ncbi:hypothetical protein F5Y14DRAFT_53323 [Nemania sp. NC0429]|nr:hypothetical protein F5Y14DRAFT_53323 [Nemania sp. NC0429]
MPANNVAGSVASSQSAPTSKRFELPALDFKFGSLTDGTDIPPPPPSPKQEVPPPQPKPQSQPQLQSQSQPQPPKTTPPKLEKVEEQQPNAERANGATNGTTPKKPDISVTTKAGLKRTADEVPVSPALSSRGSLRRLISKTFLNHAYDEQGSTTSGHNASRPPSRSASVLAEEKKAKRSSGWFWRLRSHDNNNNTTTHDAKPATLQLESVNKQLAGPPPPMIPELSALKTKVDTRLGDDLFQGIGRDS